ncbi:MAG: hypothetical protein ACYTAF_08050 [Planctomycetota bacterium]|jgi:biopolymer transport protein ExbD
MNHFRASVTILLALAVSFGAACEGDREPPAPAPEAPAAKPPDRGISLPLVRHGMEPPVSDETALIVNILADGTMRIDGKTYWSPKKPDFDKLIAIFEMRRRTRRYQMNPGDDLYVKYPLVIRADRSAGFKHIQHLLMIASSRGGVLDVRYAVKGVDGKEKVMFLPLPRGGLRPTFVEVRTYVCVDPGDIRDHLLEKRKHAERHRDDPSTCTPDECAIYVHKDKMGMLYATAKHPAKADANRAVYDRAGKKTRELFDAHGEGALWVPILDADGEVPYEHVVGLMEGCVKNGIDNLEMVGNPLFDEGFLPSRPGDVEPEPPEWRKDMDE